MIPARHDTLDLDPDQAFRTDAFRSFLELVNALKERHPKVHGDVNWGGVLNLGLDLRGEDLFMDVHDRPGQLVKYLAAIGQVIERLVDGVRRETGTSSISVNRTGSVPASKPVKVEKVELHLK